MIKRNSQILSIWFRVWDLAMTSLAWVLAYLMRFEWEIIPNHKDTPDFSLCCRNIPLVLLIAAIAYQVTGQYVISRFRRLREEAVAVTKGTILMGLLVIAVTFGLHDPYQSRATLVFFL